MQIKVIAVGKLKEKFWREAVEEYLKRLSSFARVEIIEISEEKIPEMPTAAEIRLGLAKESERILKHLSATIYTIPLAIKGKMLSSPELASHIEKLSLEGKSQVAFIIGGSHGLAPEVLERGDFPLSFSPLTFPHQLMRVLLLEQVYRAFSIINGGKYHK